MLYGCVNISGVGKSYRADHTVVYRRLDVHVVVGGRWDEFAVDEVVADHKFTLSKKKKEKEKSKKVKKARGKGKAHFLEEGSIQERQVRVCLDEQKERNIAG